MLYYTDKLKKIIAYIIIFMMLSFLLFSSIFIIKNADHDCIGDDCPVCHFIHVCENILKNLDTGKTAQSFSLFNILFCFNLLTFVFYSILKTTPIMEKVRLDN